MKNIKQDVTIAILVIIICFVITIVTKANFVWVILPVFFTILLAILGKLLREKYGSSYGITIYLFLLFAVPLIWYFFSTSMPMKSAVLESNKNMYDLESFKEYSEGVDAKTEVAKFQFKRDSILKLQVNELLKDGLVDSAMNLIKINQANSQKLKEKLFTGGGSEGQSKQYAWFPVGTKTTAYVTKPEYQRRCNLWLYRGQKVKIRGLVDCKYRLVHNAALPTEWRKLSRSDEKEEIIQEEGSIEFTTDVRDGQLINVAYLEVIE